MDYNTLVEGILALHRDSVGRAATAVDQSLVMRNWGIGAYIVEFEQAGEDRAAYGQGLLRKLSNNLAARGVRGCSPDMLERMRLFFRRYPQLEGHISVPLVRKSLTEGPTPLSAGLVLRPGGRCFGFRW